MKMECFFRGCRWQVISEIAEISLLRHVWSRHLRCKRCWCLGSGPRSNVSFCTWRGHIEACGGLEAHYLEWQLKGEIGG
jgi:hypothetical protein